jgi:hypothetical protein
MGKGAYKIPGTLSKSLNLGNHTLTMPSILKNPKLLPLGRDAQRTWDRLVQFVEEAKLKSLISEIYDSEQWADANQEDKESNRTDPKNARLPHTQRERESRRPTDKLTLRLVPDPGMSFKDLLLTGTGSFALELPTPYPAKFDSPTPIRVQIKGKKVRLSPVTVEGRATAYRLPIVGPLAKADFKLQLHYDPKDIVKAAAAIARKNGIDKKTLEELLSEIRIDVSAMGWITIFPIKAWFSAGSLLPLQRPLLGASSRPLPSLLSALPDSSFRSLGAFSVPSGVFFDVPAPGLGAHWSKFGRKSGFSLTTGFLGIPDINQFGDDWSRALSLYGYADLYYVKRLSKTIDLGIGFTYAIDFFSDRAEPTPAFLHYQESKFLPGPESRENVKPVEDRSGQKFMFKLEFTHNWLGG